MAAVRCINQRLKDPQDNYAFQIAVGDIQRLAIGQQSQASQIAAVTATTTPSSGSSPPAFYGANNSVVLSAAGTFYDVAWTPTLYSLYNNINGWDASYTTFTAPKNGFYSASFYGVLQQPNFLSSPWTGSVMFYRPPSYVANVGMARVVNSGSFALGTFSGFTWMPLASTFFLQAGDTFKVQVMTDAVNGPGTVSFSSSFTLVYLGT